MIGFGGSGFFAMRQVSAGRYIVQSVGRAPAPFRNAVAEAAAPVDTGLDIGRLRLRYTIEGDNPPWRPLHAFDDGRKVYIEVPRGIAQGEMPPLFVIGADGKTSELVNYRVRSRHMIVDRLFAAAELRLGDKGSERRVRIVRNDGGMTW